MKRSEKDQEYINRLKESVSSFKLEVNNLNKKAKNLTDSNNTLSAEVTKQYETIEKQKKANDGFTKKITEHEYICENIAKSKAYLERDPVQRLNFTALKNIIHHMNEIERLRKLVK